MSSLGFGFPLGGGGGGGLDVVDPVITIISNPLLDTDPVVISVYDDSSLVVMQLTCIDHLDAPKYVVYDRNDGFNHPFGGRSTVTGTGTSIDPYIFTVYRRGRWPTGLLNQAVFDVLAVDIGGNKVEE